VNSLVVSLASSYAAADHHQDAGGGDREGAHRLRQRRLRLRAYRQGLVTLLNEEPDGWPA
jgi:hypothetical protein